MQPVRHQFGSRITRKAEMQRQNLRCHLLRTTSLSNFRLHHCRAVQGCPLPDQHLRTTIPGQDRVEMPMEVTSPRILKSDLTQRWIFIHACLTRSTIQDRGIRQRTGEKKRRASLRNRQSHLAFHPFGVSLNDVVFLFPFLPVLYCLCLLLFCYMCIGAVKSVRLWPGCHV